MCIFCKIIDGEIPAKTVVAENDNFLAFEDINKQAKIHILIMPKKHIESFQNLTATIMGEMTLFIQEITKKLDIADDGYRLVTNIGVNGGQEINHIHFHLLAGEKLGKII